MGPGISSHVDNHFNAVNDAIDDGENQSIVEGNFK